MSDASKYGENYYCIKTALSMSGEIYAYADTVRITEHGILILANAKASTLAFAPGQWTCIYAASVLDGHAVSVEHWLGEVQR